MALKKHHRSVAEMALAETRAHVKDCLLYRKRTLRQLDDMSRRQEKMHEENREDRASELQKIRDDIASIKQAEAKAKSRRLWWWDRGREAAIGALFLGLVYALWHIITTKNLGPSW